MQQAALLDGLSLDALAFLQDGLTTIEVDIGRSEVVQALLVTPVVVVIDEGSDPRLERAGQAGVLEQDAVLQGLVPALDLALGVQVTGCTADRLDRLAGEPVGQVINVAWPVVGQQPWPMTHPRFRDGTRRRPLARAALRSVPAAGRLADQSGLTSEVA